MKRINSEIINEGVDVAEALFTLNQAAKRLNRLLWYNKKMSNGKCAQHKLIKLQQKYYSLKEDVIANLVDNGLAEVIGIHSKEVYGNRTYFTYYRVGNYKFHLPTKTNEGLPYLGEYFKYNSEYNYKSPMRITKAEYLLESFVKEGSI
ncbi:YkyB family protein [Paenibacillus sp. FSL M7-0802]|uniref:YkyB family protein n=1 Tax=Paenibacillus sp. FSL M7-0802 TaxID=2921536 RepID=UPI0030F5B322